jgi:hypothetical protein
VGLPPSSNVLVKNGGRHTSCNPSIGFVVRLEDEENDDPIGHVTMFSSLTYLLQWAIACDG